MNLVLNSNTVDLRGRSGLEIRNGRGVGIVCLRGRVWITQEGDPRDVVLEAGESFTLDRQGLAVVEALKGEPSIRIVEPGRFAGIARLHPCPGKGIAAQRSATPCLS